MPSPDLSKMNAAQREELIIGFLFEHHAMLLTLLEDQVEALVETHGMSTENARKFIAQQVAENKNLLIESLGLTPQPRPNAKGA